MHKDFTFQPATSSHFVEQRLITPLPSVGDALAGAALRAYGALAQTTGDTLPGLAHGRLHLPEQMLFSHNNPDDPEGTPFPLKKLTLEHVEGDPRRITCLVFTDRSALICIEDTNLPKPFAVPIMQVLPIVMSLPSKLRFRLSGRAYKLSVKQMHGMAQIFLTSDRIGSEPFMFLGEPNTRHEADDEIYLSAALDSEIRGWGREIPKCPLVMKGEPHHRSGILGKHIPAPFPELEGKSFAWPAAFPTTNFTEKEVEQAKAFLHLALVRLAETFEDQVADFFCVYLAAEPRQDGKKGTLEPKMEVAHMQAATADKTLKKDMLKELKRLLRHEKAPAFLADICGHGLTASARDKKRMALKRYTLYHARLSDCLSRHDRLRAHSLFGPLRKT